MDKRNMRLGTLLLGFGLGLLAAQLSPRLGVLWPYGFVLVGVLLLRRWGSPSVRGFLLSLSLGAALLSHDLVRVRPSMVGIGPARVVARFESTLEQAEAWVGVRELVVENGSGDIRVEGGAGGVALGAVYRQRGGAGRVPEGLQVSFDEAEGRLTLLGVDPALPQSARRGVSAALTARVPEGVALRTVSRIGDVRAEELSAAHIDSNVGDVRLSEVAGTVVAETDVGDIEVSEASGGVEVSTKVGDITLEFPTSPRAPILAQADVGDIELSLPREADVSITARSQARDLSDNLTRRSPTEGQLRLGAGTQPIALATRVGEVEVELR